MSSDLEIVRKAVEDYKKMVERFQVPFVQLQDLAERMDKSLEPIRAVSKIFIEQQMAITKAFKMLDSVFPKIQELQDFARRVQEAWKRDKEAIEKSGWWFTPSLMNLPAGSMASASRKYLSGDKRAMTDFFVSTYHKNDFRYLKQAIFDWQKNNYFKPWNKHLNQALRAHIAGEYTLSVPTFLLAAEGIAKKYCKTKGEKAFRNKGNDKINKALKRAGLDNSDVQKDLEMLDIDIFFTALDSKVYGDTSSFKGARGFRYILNRHAVLHGESPHYGTRKNSLQCLMLLDVMSLLK